MFLKLASKFTFKLLVIIIYFSSCNKPGCTDSNAINYNIDANKNDGSCEYEANDIIINLKLFHYFNNALFSLDSIYKDDFQNKIRFTRASFYFGNPHYKNNSDSLISSTQKKYVLINPTIEKYPFDTVSNELFTQIDFVIGIDSNTNNTNPIDYSSDNSLSQQSPFMHWDMNPPSYLFIVLEGELDKNNDDNFDSGFLFHIGGNGFTSSINNIPIDLPQTQNSQYEIQLNVNWANFIDSIDLAIDNFSHTENDITLAQKIVENSLDVISTH